jgi:murein DD-endopeptidase MepM/ murein hydrolase activator NlpD
MIQRVSQLTSVKNYISASATYGIGGYDEHRTVYSRSKVFDTIEEPRRLHLGVDIWGNAGTPVYAPIDGTVHSFAFNDQYGDYGATIILSHATKERSFHTLYGHLSLSDLNGLSEGQIIRAGQEIAHFGQPQENGHWPPHLHFQMIIDMQGMNGDFPAYANSVNANDTWPIVPTRMCCYR